MMVAVLAAAPPKAPAAATDLARRVEQRHRAVKDLSARFTQTYRSLLLGREVVERGTVRLKPPGRMRWEYKDPEKKTFVSDGSRVYFHVPADGQVIVRDNAGERGVAVNLLSGRSEILADFDVSLEEDGRLRLVPRKPDPDVEQAVIRADPSGRIQEIEIYDAQGNRSRFSFDGVRENTGLADSEFEFVPPPGTEVIGG